MTPEEIHIKFTPHVHQHYDTAGDYFELNNKWEMRVSITEDWRHAALVAVHELCEMILTKNNGVKWEDIDHFDTNGAGADHPDPGSLTSAPYHTEHVLAIQIEKTMAQYLNIDWDEYNKALDALEYRTC